MKKVFIGKKKMQYYKGLLIKADLGLHEQIAEKIKNCLPPGSKILDVGCGEGALSQRLHDLGYSVVATDINAEDFKAKDIEFIQINFNRREEVENFLDTYYEAFDAVLAVEIIEHIQNPWQFVDDLLKLLKKNGLLLITTPNITNWISRLKFLLSGKFHQFDDADLAYGHIAPISAWELNVILKSKNLEEVEFKEAGTLPPIYITGINKLLILNFIALILRPFMKGYVDGWCIMVTARKPS